MLSQLIGVLVLVVVGVAGPGAAPAEGFRVLGLFPFNGRSHSLMFKAMMQALADRGHEVVDLSPFPLKKARANYTDLDLSPEFPSLVNSLTFEQMANPDVSNLGILNIIEELAGAGLCRKVFATKHFKDIMNGVHGQFDVVFTEIFGSDCWAAVAYKMKVPLISMVSAPDFTWASDRTGSVDNPSYIAAGFLDNVGRMSFWGRLENTYYYLLAKYLHQRWMQDPSDEVVREVFGADMPPISELVRNTSLVMLNRHDALNPSRPVNPNVIHVSGLHLRPAKPNGAGLEPGLRAWMDDAEHGVIFFTLGSLVRTSSMPKEKIHALRDAFGALPQRVLWKFETSDIEDLPPNVRIASWLPQMDVLAHPKTILFITHGGLMGTIEAVFAGVPMLGIPLFADQSPNIALYKSLGIAERLDHTAITKDGMLAAIREMTVTDRYRVRAREIAARYRDRPRWATEEAVWWTEYVVRHGGAPHLRPLGADMPLYQYLLLDVVAFVLAVVLAVLLAVVLLVKRLCCSSSAPRAKEKRN